MLESERILIEKNIPYKLIELSDRALTVNDVIMFSKGDIVIEEICKTIILKDKIGSIYAFFLLGKDRIDMEKVYKLVGKRLKVANRLEVKELTGTEPGAICPLILKTTLYIDNKIESLRHVNFGSGDHLYGIELKTADLLNICPHIIADISI